MLWTDLEVGDKVRYSKEYLYKYAAPKSYYIEKDKIFKINSILILESFINIVISYKQVLFGFHQIDYQGNDFDFGGKVFDIVELKDDNG